MTTIETGTDADNIAPTSYIAGQTAFGVDIVIERTKPFGWKIILKNGVAPKEFDGVFTRLEDAQWVAHMYQYNKVHRYRNAVDDEARKENKRRGKNSSS